MGRSPFDNNRGVALLIVLLVTALLVALVFEFAYTTRVSLRAAANFRDSQRAEFLARSGIKVFLKYKELQETIPQGIWSVVPMVSAGDTELKIRWEDEKGKINIKNNLYDANILTWVGLLFTNTGVDQVVLDKIKDEFKGGQINLLGELHRVMSDEDFIKVSQYLTVSSGQKLVNVNTASDVVLKSMGIEPALIVPNRPYTSKDIHGVDANKKSYLDITSDFFTIYSSATVGNYTKQVIATFDRGTNVIIYWRSV